MIRSSIACLATLAFLTGCSSNDERTDSSTSDDKLETNKATAIAFYTTAFNDHDPEEAVAKYVGDKYIQHNPFAGDGKQAFIDFVKSYAQQNPELKIEVKRAVSEGDLVVVHVRQTVSATDRGTAAMDIFRLENGKVVEHWDAVQAVPETSANPNGMF